MAPTVRMRAIVLTFSVLGACHSATPAAPSASADATSSDGTTTAQDIVSLGDSPTADTAKADAASGDVTTTSGDAQAFVPTVHPDLPQVLNMGGKVLTNPRVVPVLYSDDPYGADVQKLLQQIAASTYWPTIASEYGVGPLQIGSPILQSGKAPAKLAEGDTLAWLDKGLADPSTPWGKVDANTIYMLVIPPQTDFISGTGSDAVSCCADRGGYHDEVQLAGTLVPYAVVCACAYPELGLNALDDLTSTIAHELIEAATDPFSVSAPAFSQQSNADAAWTDISDGEVGDLCEFNQDSNIHVSGIDYLVTRSWSNLAAAAGHEPCLPSPDPGPYFAAAPLVKDTVNILDFLGNPVQAKGVKIGLGQSRTVDVQLFSDGPVSGPWQVKAYDFEQEIQGQAKPKLAFTWDKSTGNNGDVLHLTIQVLATDSNWGGELFLIESKLGSRTSEWMGVVGQ